VAASLSAWVAVGRTPALVLGRSQHALRPDTALRVRRRASGGGAVLTGPWMLRALLRLPRAHPLARGGPTALARWFGGLHLPWLRGLGIADADLYAGPFEDHWACFLGRGPGEVLVGDRKLVGIAQAWHRDRILLWSATLLEPSPWARLGEAFGQPEAADSLAAGTISARECVGGRVESEAWVGSLREVLAVQA
jgi:lipoate---protein ligase